VVGTVVDVLLPNGADTSGPTVPPAVLRQTLGVNNSTWTGKGIGVAVIDSGLEMSSEFSGRVGELVTRGFRPAGEGVWRSPGGVVVKMRKQKKDWRFEELVFEGSVIATRVEEGIRVRAGDVEVSPAGDGYEVQLKKG